MDGEAIMVVSTSVVALTQLIKWMGLPVRFAPILIITLSAIGVCLWGYTRPDMVTRIELWSYFAGWIAVATSAAGVFGFSRAASNSIRHH